MRGTAFALSGVDTGSLTARVVPSTVSSDIDDAIEKNLHAALIQAGYKDGVDYSVKSGVVTLTGTVQTEATRAAVEKVAAGVPNVAQVVNTVEIENHRATSTR